MDKSKILEKLAAIEGYSYCELEDKFIKRDSEGVIESIFNPWRYTVQIVELMKKYRITVFAPDDQITFWYSNCDGSHFNSWGETLEDAVIMAVIDYAGDVNAVNRIPVPASTAIN